MTRSTDIPVTRVPDPLAKMLDDAVKLCPLPATTQRVIRLTESDKASVAVIVQAISNDPALATAVLGVANSAMYSGPKLAQLDAAVIRIGLRELGELATAMAHLARFRSRDGVQVLLHDRSVLACSIANRTAKATGLVPASIASTCGLLCEIGAMVCLAVAGKEYATLWKESAQSPLARMAQERERYGVSSYEIGRRFLLRGQTPEEVCSAVGVEPDADPSATNPLQKLSLFARNAAPLLLAAGAYSKLPEHLELLALQIGFPKLSGKELFEMFRTSDLMRA